MAAFKGMSCLNGWLLFESFLARLNLCLGGLNMMLGKLIQMAPCLVKRGASNL